MLDHKSTQQYYDDWKEGYNHGINAAIRELRTPLQNLVDALAYGDTDKISIALKAARHGLAIYDPE